MVKKAPYLLGDSVQRQVKNTQQPVSLKNGMGIDRVEYRGRRIFYGKELVDERADQLVGLSKWMTGIMPA